MSDLYSKEWFKDFVDDFEHLYFCERDKISEDGEQIINSLGIKVNNNVCREYEENIIKKIIWIRGL